MANQGFSGILNEDKLGCERTFSPIDTLSPPHRQRADTHTPTAGWFDHPRDLLYMINTFRMPRPMIGIGHSIGGNALVNLSLMHPRLLDTLVLIDPVFAPLKKAADEWGVAGEWGVLAASAFRRDKWPSREAAAKGFKKNKFWSDWDPRVFDLWIKYGLRETPTKIYPTAPATASQKSNQTSANATATATAKEVTLSTTKHQEIFSFSRFYPSKPRPTDPPDSLLHPEARMYTNHGTPAPFYRAEAHITFNNLPHLRPSVLYIFGETSDLTPLRESKMATTGIGEIGSGGVAKGMVEDIMVMGTGHLIPMEKVGETARHSARWVGKWYKGWVEGEEKLRRYWAQVPEREKYMLGKDYFDALRPPGDRREISKL